MVAVVLDRLILAWVNRVDTGVWLCAAVGLVVDDSRLCGFICLLVFLVTRSLFKRLALLVINLAVSVPRHYWTCLAMVSVLNWLSSTVPQLRITCAPFAPVCRLEMVHLLILSGCYSNILFPNLSILMCVMALATSPWLNDTTLLDWAELLGICSLDRTHRSLGWNMVSRVLSRLPNSKLKKLFDVLWRHLGWCSNLDDLCFWLVMASWLFLHLHILWAYPMLLIINWWDTVWRISWALPWGDIFWTGWTLIHVPRARCGGLWANVSWIFTRLVRCVSSKEISAFWANLEVTWTWTCKSLIRVCLSNDPTVDVVCSMSRVLSMIFHCLLLLVWNLLQKRKVIGFSVFFLYFWWIHILWINNFKLLNSNQL
jgi:hypothetical protein